MKRVRPLVDGKLQEGGVQRVAGVDLVFERANDAIVSSPTDLGVGPFHHPPPPTAPGQVDDNPTQVRPQSVHLAPLGAATDAPTPGRSLGDQVLGNLAIASQNERQPSQPPMVLGHRDLKCVDGDSRRYFQDLVHRHGHIRSDAVQGFRFRRGVRR